jgi:hypothetical protein
LTASVYTDTNRASAPRSNPWIVNAPTDLLFIHGGIFFIAFAFFLLFVGNPNGNITLSGSVSERLLYCIWLSGQMILTAPHTMATLARAYATAATRRKYSFYCWILPFLLLPAAWAGVTVPGAASVLAEIYLLWNFQHVCSQAYGISLIYCHKSGYFLEEKERILLKYLFLAIATFGILVELSDVNLHRSDFFGLSLPFWGLLPASCLQVFHAVLLLVLLAFAALVLRRRSKLGQWLPPSVISLLAAPLIWVLLPGGMRLAYGILVGPFWHSSQYMVLSLACYQKQRHADAKCLTLAERGTMQYAAVLTIFGIAVSVGIPIVLVVLGFDWLRCYSTMIAVINIHHFLLDGAIWRLRDPEVRRLLLQ